MGITGGGGVMNSNMNHITKLKWGYWVRFTKADHPTISKTFLYSQYAGGVATLTAAKQWRDENTPADYGHTNARRARHFSAPTERSTTGVLGVTHVTREYKNGTICTAYKATWAESIGGVRKQVSTQYGYDITRNGDDARALKLATKHRKRMEKEHYVGVR